MNKLLQISLTIGVIFTVPSALATSSYAQTQTQPNAVQPKTQNSQVKFAFDFKNTYDYAACLDVILLAYENRTAELNNTFKNDCATKVLDTFGDDLSRDTALKLIESADMYATTKLENPLYPTLGLRRRIAINLGYVYEADKNNPDILKYTNPESE